MNWLGWSTRAILAALLGALLGAALYAYALAHGVDAPYAVGIASGVGALVGAPDRSTMRGLLVATAAIWIAAVVQSQIGPFAAFGIVGFHTTLGWKRSAWFTVCGLAAFLLARTSLRRDAKQRAAGR